MEFFSADWCNEAAEQANTSDVRETLVDAGSFDLILAFECADLPEICSWALFEAGAIKRWVPGEPPPGTTKRVTLRAPLSAWQQAANGDCDATSLLLGGKIKLKDYKSRITSNYQALDALLAAWEHVPTTWPDPRA